MINTTININNPIQVLKDRIEDSTRGLPEDIFLFVSSITPLVNVDILIKNEKNQILLSWRNGSYTEQGWHFPGRILRFKSTLEKCIQDLINEEIKKDIILNKCPLEYNEMIHDYSNIQNIRSHFISFLYEGFLDSNTILFTKKLSSNYNGYLKWFDYCPENLIECHKKVYNKYFKEKR